MKLTALIGQALRIPFRGSFRHASAERAETQSWWVTARTSSCIGYGEGCPREYVTQESLASAEQFFNRHHAEWMALPLEVAAIRDWAITHASEIDAAPAAWCAVEIALLDVIGRATGQSLESLLGEAELAQSFEYSAILSDDASAAFMQRLAQYRAAGFRQFKIKLSGDLARDRSKVAALQAAGISHAQVRADANNLWSDAATALAHLSALDYPFWALEEPLRADDLAGMCELSRATGARIVLDESFRSAALYAELQQDATRWLLNVRVSKLGGLIRSLSAITAARRSGFGIVVGAHVGETSVLTRAALTVAAVAGDALVAQEGAAGTHLLVEDVAEPPLMFGAGGLLIPQRFRLPNTPGLGLTMTDLAAHHGWNR